MYFLLLVLLQIISQLNFACLGLEHRRSLQTHFSTRPKLDSLDAAASSLLNNHVCVAFVLVNGRMDVFRRPEF